MQTFLPYPSFIESAKCLDNKRLGKQRVEAYQILRTIQGKSQGWKNHPAVKMWVGYEDALKAYLNAMIVEWVRRGYNNTMTVQPGGMPLNPIWIGSERFHASHRSNLLRKDPKHYVQFGWKESTNLPYFWPTKEGY